MTPEEIKAIIAAEVAAAVAGLTLPTVDLSGYAKTSDIPALPDLSGYASAEDVKSLAADVATLVDKPAEPVSLHFVWLDKVLAKWFAADRPTPAEVDAANAG